ncbi:MULTISPECIES: hypothetical protein [unclassified Imperialibacter]|uniref:hypothetical protein n=1 Tax=unclassified Imperialibacter TaxID=2629706 RepID=UPI001259894B|nr:MULTISPECIES: hypothetical protein [unclassified Imperialibacter]CAD5252569.1 conserved membrane hypothetical protein [Imperialibacter sp. 89]CAD5260669.1 conserved membrane hypothetical protein [Imperialibacter sp. 75]VVT04050.1 conserved membrane hypothetical protein [Imperialibacter sp. EC-SDR9]
MSSWILSFEPLLNIHLTLWGLILLFVIIAVAEWRRKMGRKLFRLSALLLAFIGLAGVLLRPHYQSESALSDIMLLTKGYNGAKADSLLQTNPGLSVYKALDAADFKAATDLKSFSQLTGIKERIRYVLGAGLPDYVFDDASSLRFAYFPSSSPEGIQAIDVPEKVNLNRRSAVSGVVIQGTPGSMIRWSGPEGRMDSLMLLADTEGFSFGFVPKLAGKFIYELELLDSAGSSTATYKVPVQVAEERKLKMVFVSQFPTFESRYLKNLLAEQGHSLALRYQLSKDKFSYEFANQAEVPFRRLTTTLLDDADLLWIDEASLDALNREEANALNAAVDQGLGVFITVNQQSASRNARRWMPLQLTRYDADTLSVAVDLGRQVSLSGVGLAIDKSPEIIPVWEDTSGSVLAAYAYQGQGKIGTSLWQDTYRLVLKGQELTYAALWMEVIESLARKASVCCDIQVETKEPYFIDEPIRFTVISSLEEPPLVSYKGETVPLIESWQLDNVWSGTIWPDATGWDSLFVDAAGQSKHFFVQEQSDWQSVAFSQQIANTALHASKEPGISRRYVQTIKKPISAVIFYLLLLVGFGGLWLAPKV